MLEKKLEIWVDNRLETLVVLLLGRDVEAIEAELEFFEDLKGMGNLLHTPENITQERVRIKFETARSIRTFLERRDWEALKNISNRIENNLLNRDWFEEYFRRIEEAETLEDMEII